MPSTNLYEVLSIPGDADVAAIQKAFKELSLKMHPDKANKSTIPPRGETETEREAREGRNHERFVKIVEARDILTDPIKRREYDEQQRNIKEDSTSEATRHSEPRNHNEHRTDSERRTYSVHRTYGEHGTYSVHMTYSKHWTHSEPSKTNEDSEPKEKKVPWPYQVLKRLEPLDTDLNRTLGVFRSLASRSRQRSPWSNEDYDRLEAKFADVISINTRMIERIKRTGQNIENHDWEERASYEAAVEKAGSYIPYARDLIFELDSALNGHDVSKSRESLYDTVGTAFYVFPS
ncbi:hypothetical protein GQX73_g10638 [Xylaria multiplex]|uniref:J domain-containing protein n=1 Tax=Xylaria multiplex TaxID=323545 RepID=A0A7C8MHY8_9PEZI|nr:hypothetical protein GQX73_g10638 [Xylaria multiplex]